MKSENIWCFFRNELCPKQGEFSYPWVTSSKKVFYSYTTKSGVAHNKAMREDIQKILNKHGYELVTFEEAPIPSTAYYCEKICKAIHESAFLIADISCLGSPSEIIYNPNIMLEMGIAAGYGIPIIIVADKGIHPSPSELPSNLRGIQVMIYDTDFKEAGSFEKAVIELTNRLLNIPNFQSIASFEDSNMFQVKLENITSNRYFLGRYPLSIMRLNRMTKERAEVLQRGKFDTEDAAQKYIDYVDDRRIGLQKLLENPECRCSEIYTKKSFMDFFRKGKVRDHYNPKSEVKDRLEALKTYFEKKNYYIGLLKEETAPHYFLAKENYGLLIYSGTRRYKSFTGEIITSQRRVVEEYIKLHKKIWAEIEDDDKDKRKLMQRMEEGFANFEGPE